MKSDIPNNWTTMPLGECLDVILSNVDKKINPEETEVKLCNYMDVYHNDFITNDLMFMVGSANDRELVRFKLYEGDVIITKDSESPDDIAVPSYVVEDLDNVICGYHLAILRPRDGLIHGGFLSKLLQLKEYQHSFFRVSNGATRYGLTSDSIKGINLTFPSYEEQKSIYDILLTWKKKINTLNELLGLKEKFFKGIKQQALTGKRRLSKDFGPWKNVTVNDLIEEYTEKSKVQDKFRMITSSRNGLVLQEEHFKGNRLTKRSNIGSNIIPPSYITYRSRSDDGMFYFNMNKADETFLVSKYYPVFKSKECSDFLRYLLNFHARTIGRMAVGTSQVVLGIGALKKFSFMVPQEEEQRKISSLLANIEKEIQNILNKKLLYEDQLKGLMQQLLTGKKRVNTK